MKIISDKRLKMFCNKVAKRGTNALNQHSNSRFNSYGS